LKALKGGHEVIRVKIKIFIQILIRQFSKII